MKHIILAIITIIACYFIWQIFIRENASKHISLNNDMKRLVNACLGDKEKAIRLLEYERKLNPYIRTSVAIDNAIDRLQRDRS